MKYVEIYTGEDNKSYFKEVDAGVESQQPLGSYSGKHPVSDMMFRDFEAGNVFDWHPAPQTQYIAYLEGLVEVQASGGESRIFREGDVLLANDLTGQGHITRTLTKGRSLVIKI